MYKQLCIGIVEYFHRPSIYLVFVYQLNFLRRKTKASEYRVRVYGCRGENNRTINIYRALNSDKEF